MKCFNPCFTGYGSDAMKLSACSLWRPDVSILVLLDMALMHDDHREQARGVGVSILVLLDMALMLYSPFGFALRSKGFNPCFTGYGSDAILGAPPSRIPACFNPCFTGYGSDAEKYLT